MMGLAAGRYQTALLVAFVAAAVLTSLSPIYPDQLLLQHLPTALILAVLIGTSRRFPLSNPSFTLVLAFFGLHLVGARWIYSFVPYDDWTSALFGTRLSEVFGWERNHYDRFVHFAFGALLVVPIEEVVRRIVRPRRGWSYYMAVEFVLAASVIYELVEWGIALTFAPTWADRYLGQQGDMWDAHKDVALASLGAIVVTCGFAIARAARRRRGVLVNGAG